MPTDTMNSGSYVGILTANAGLEGRLYFFQYSSLESQLSPVQPIHEPDDPPETLYTPWGVWRHYRDALHRIDEMFDAEHLVRKSRPAEDILHEAHYVPTIGDPIHKEESYQMKTEYNDPAQLEVYNSRINLEYFAGTDFEEGTKEESTKLYINMESKDDSIDTGNKDSKEKPEEPNLDVKDRTQKTNFDLESEKELTNIFKKHIKNSA